MGYIINRAEILKARAEEVLPLCEQKANPEKVNEFLIDIRREFW